MMPVDFSLPVGHGLSDIEQMRAFNMSRRPGWEDSQVMWSAGAPSGTPDTTSVPLHGGMWSDYEGVEDMPMQTPQNAAPFDLWPLGME